LCKGPSTTTTTTKKRNRKGSRKENPTVRDPVFIFGLTFEIIIQW